MGVLFMNDYKFQPGDRVIAVRRENFAEVKNGETGTVIGYRKGVFDNLVAVEWDRKKSSRHNEEGAGREGHCWRVNEECLELIGESDSEEFEFDAVDIADYFCV